MTTSHSTNDRKKIDEFEKKPKPKRKKSFWLLVFALPLLIPATLYLIPTTFYIVGNGNILSADDAVLRAGSKGPIQAILARTGDQVKKSQILLQLEDDVERAELERCQRELARAQAELNFLLETNQLERQKEKLAIEAAEIQYEDSKGEVTRLEKLYKSAAVSDFELRVAVTQREINRISLLEKNLNKDNLRQADIDIKKRNIETWKAQLDSAQRMLARRKVHAPMAGVLVMHSYSIGQVVDANEVLGQIFDNRYYQIIAHIPEKFQSFLKTDQDAEIELSAYPWWDFGYLPARVYRVSPVVNPQASGDGTIMIKAKIENNNTNIQLKAGMAGEIWIKAGKTSLLYRILGIKPYDNHTTTQSVR
jgi:HlyD family secretion protein